MRKLFLFITIILPAILGATNIEQQVIDAYQANKFDDAVTILETELKTQKEAGKESADLYYNLGNAHFRANDVPQAILYYEKALLLNPGDRDTRHNIEYAKTKIEDKILEVDEFFLASWFEAVQNCFTSGTWATLSIILFLILIGCSVVFFFLKSLGLKKIAFYVGIVAIPLLIFTNVFSINQKNKLTNRNTAIIMASSVSVVTSPDSNSKELFILHAGTKVKINKEDKDWLEIELENGHIGWMQKNKLAII